MPDSFDLPPVRPRRLERRPAAMAAALVVLTGCMVAADGANEFTQGEGVTDIAPVAAGSAEQSPRLGPGEGKLAPGEPPPAGGFEPLGEPGRASAYWARNGQRLDIANPWRGVAGDGFHDPDSDAIGVLQNPREAMRELPRGDTGNFVDWVGALRQGAIQPRAAVAGDGAMERLDLDVILRDTRNMPTVTFSHRIHTEWLACENCHETLFAKRAGATDIRMADIFAGQACGVCHGKVAFPPDQCFVCHNGPRKQ